LKKRGVDTNLLVETPKLTEIWNVDLQSLVWAFIKSI
jgi:hypothetical protein